MDKEQNLQEDLMEESKLLEERLEKCLDMNGDDCIGHLTTLFDRQIDPFPFNNKLVIFGAGALGRKTIECLLETGIKPIAISDNNPLLWGGKINDIDILPPDETFRLYKNDAIFVVTIYNSKKVCKQLSDNGCRHVLSYSYLFWKFPQIFLPYYSLDYPSSIFHEKSEIRNCYHIWEDDKSREEFVAQLEWHVSLNPDRMPAPSAIDQLYFPLDILAPSREESFVDCGAYDGDTIHRFLRIWHNEFRQVTAIEPDLSNYEKLKKSVANLPLQVANHIEIKPFALGAERKQVLFAGNGTVTSLISKIGDSEVESVPLDDLFIEQNPTYIKMDIEGAELDALAGAKKIIQHGTTVFAICLYHRMEDLWRIPLFIHSLSDKYRFFLRRYAEDCWEVVLYAIPFDRWTR